jgi:multidrug resistance protein, MATE family
MDHSQPSASYKDLFTLSVPLILSMSGIMLMQFIDAIFLSWYSPDAIAAVVPAGMASLFLTSAFSGTAGYTSTFVAQYLGAGRRDAAAHAVWQGNWFAIVSGGLLVFVALLATPLFRWVGHAPHLQSMEATFFRISCYGSLFTVLTSALSGFFSGRGDTRTVMVVQLSSLALNALLDYVLIFGRFGLPRLGITGAALATVMASGVGTLVFFALFLNRRNRTEWATWKSCAFDAALCKRIVRFGFPSGARFTVEMLAWTVFVAFVGRIGSADLAVTNIAWRINGIAFFPAIGFSMAVGILVGNAQGAKQPVVAKKVAWRGLLITQAWMLVMAVIFLLLPVPLLNIFNTHDPSQTLSFTHLVSRGVVLLRFVALYCLLDGFNYVFVSTLTAAGDTRWTLVMTLVLNAAFIASLFAADLWCRTLYTEWVIATAFVMVQALVWFARFMQGKWKDFEVVEQKVVE